MTYIFTDIEMFVPIYVWKAKYRYAISHTNVEADNEVQTNMCGIMSLYNIFCFIGYHIVSLISSLYSILQINTRQTSPSTVRF